MQKRLEKEEILSGLSSLCQHLGLSRTTSVRTNWKLVIKPKLSERLRFRTVPLFILFSQDLLREPSASFFSEKRNKKKKAHCFTFSQSVCYSCVWPIVWGRRTEEETMSHQFRPIDLHWLVFVRPIWSYRKIGKQGGGSGVSDWNAECENAPIPPPTTPHSPA